MDGSWKDVFCLVQVPPPACLCLFAVALAGVDLPPLSLISSTTSCSQQLASDPLVVVPDVVETSSVVVQGPLCHSLDRQAPLVSSRRNRCTHVVPLDSSHHHHRLDVVFSV